MNPLEDALQGMPIGDLVRLMSKLEAIHPEFKQIRRTSRATSSEQGRRLAQRLQQSILPVFIGDERGRPLRLGSCVLALVDSKFFAFTAGHVLDDAGQSPLWAATGVTPKLQRLPYKPGFHASPNINHDDLDVGVLPLSASALGSFAQCIFLALSEIDENDQPDDRSFASFSFVLGYSASRSQVKVQHEHRQIHQISFHLKTSPAGVDTYQREGISPHDHVLLEFDRKRTFREGKSNTAPELQGVSGGGIFQITRHTEVGPLVAIATEHRSKSRAIVGTRIKHFLTIARALISAEAELFR